MPSVLGLIPARGGSKRLLGKNIKLLAGRPLIAWTILEAQKSKLLTCLIVSTEDRAVMEVAWKYGCDVLQRPRELAADEASSLAVVRHAVHAMRGYDYVCLLQPTSPLREARDIDDAITYAIQGQQHCVSVDDSDTPNGPPNGMVYVWRTNLLDEPCKWFMAMQPGRSVDIDTQADFDRADELMLARIKDNRKPWWKVIADYRKGVVKNGG